jgi:hypothetical protein
VESLVVANRRLVSLPRFNDLNLIYAELFMAKKVRNAVLFVK